MKQQLIPQVQKKPIIRVLCPYCQKNYLVLRNRQSNLNLSFFVRKWKEEREWHCSGGCISSFPENYFDVFPQFEKFVERKV
ncbi:MAG: hypothetical protein ABSG05_03375 [Candidatus Pacearchaeota archaeon]|jgi:hypothetical protein